MVRLIKTLDLIKLNNTFYSFSKVDSNRQSKCVNWLYSSQRWSLSFSPVERVVYFTDGDKEKVL